MHILWNVSTSCICISPNKGLLVTGGIFLVSLLTFHPSWVTDGKKSAISLAKSLTSYISCKSNSAQGRRWRDIINICFSALRQLCWLNWCTLRLCSDVHHGKLCFNHLIPQSELQIKAAHNPRQSTQTSTCPSALLWGLQTASPKNVFLALGSWVFVFPGSLRQGCVSKKLSKNKQQRIILLVGPHSPNQNRWTCRISENQ